ncbi:MAG: nuclease, partial [Microbacteriaceae bacterium]|nr:nuclease [Microbacteriaceae bacterium]
MKSHRRSFYARSLVFALGGAVALVSVVGCSALFLELPIGTESRSGAERSASAAPEPAPVDAVPSGELATTLLASLPIKGRAAKTGYDREDQFGTAWFDVDRNGCD